VDRARPEADGASLNRSRSGATPIRRAWARLDGIVGLPIDVPDGVGSGHLWFATLDRCPWATTGSIADVAYVTRNLSGFWAESASITLSALKIWEISWASDMLVLAH
jgi:hypothetical protein